MIIFLQEGIGWNQENDMQLQLHFFNARSLLLCTFIAVQAIFDQDVNMNAVLNVME